MNYRAIAATATLSFVVEPDQDVLAVHTPSGAIALGLADEVTISPV